MLSYSECFYERQFITRKLVNNDLLTRIEQLSGAYFTEDKALTKGLPTVQYVANQQALSSGYLSDLIRSLTGMNAQLHIHQKLVEQAKILLLEKELSKPEIAFQLDFVAVVSNSTKKTKRGGCGRTIKVKVSGYPYVVV